MSIEFLRKFCSQLPGTTEDIKWDNDLCFCVAKKMYCVTPLEGPFRTSLKCNDEDFGSLIERDHIILAPYMARNKWVMIRSHLPLQKRNGSFL